MAAVVVGYPCCILVAVVPSSAAVNTPKYSVAFGHSLGVAVDVAAEAAVVAHRGGNPHLEERTVVADAAVGVDAGTGQAVNRWTMARHYCSPLAAVGVEVAAVAAILDTTTGAAYDDRTLDSDDDLKTVAGIDHFRIRVGW